MITHELNYRIFYADTDAMGVVYYANYLRIYEAARGDFMRRLGFSFGDMEKKGIVCPAINVNIEYIRFVKFDEEVKVVSTVKEIPGAKLVFLQEMIDSKGNVVNRATVKLGFVSTEKMKAVRCPEWIAELFKKAIKK
ncbi:MAG TPA: thioesterase family protein [Bacteroidales bacterium]|nr:thioesterase family protein [Bacteroidales bacterium]HOL98518.1 thioesterase family protein [Bacteroidales bacterium]HOM35677.1 thioesterase family protein [Bacteroidales bacterium]HPD23184.1 thioesterase family protein [Bacteroidales bacterium]HRS99113.1 thioesterase family protein [Bacteroidales bacterium]